MFPLQTQRIADRFVHAGFRVKYNVGKTNSLSDGSTGMAKSGNFSGGFWGFSYVSNYRSKKAKWGVVLRIRSKRFQKRLIWGT